MSAAIRLINSAGSAWVDAALSVVWQSTVLIVVVVLVLHFCRRLPPAVRCWAWRLVALKLLLMPFWVTGVPLLAPSATLPAAAPHFDDAQQSATLQPAGELLVDPQASHHADFTVEAATPAPVAEPAVRPTWQAAVLAFYAAIVVLQLARLVWQRHLLGRMIQTTEPASAQVANLVAECSAELGLHRPPETRVAPAEISPFVCRIRRPLLVLPASLAASAGPQLRPIVLHELAHIRRRDLVWRLAMELTRILWWFHPLAHWVSYRESLERELACDQLAMLHARFSAADYARTLVDAASRMAFPSVLRAAVAANFDGGEPRSTSTAKSSAHHFLRSLET